MSKKPSRPKKNFRVNVEAKADAVTTTKLLKIKFKGTNSLNKINVFKYKTMAQIKMKLKLL